MEEAAGINAPPACRLSVAWITAILVLWSGHTDVKTITYVFQERTVNVMRAWVSAWTELNFIQHLPLQTVGLIHANDEIACVSNRQKCFRKLHLVSNTKENKQSIC